MPIECVLLYLIGPAICRHHRLDGFVPDYLLNNRDPIYGLLIGHQYHTHTQEFMIQPDRRYADHPRALCSSISTPPFHEFELRIRLLHEKVSLATEYSARRLEMQ
jgi:hypothetical protein